MVDYANFVAMAQRLITAAGREVTLIRHSTTPADAAKPWRGPSQTLTVLDGPDPDEPGKAGFVVPAVFADEGSLGQEFQQMLEGLVKRGAKVALIAAADVGDEDLDTFDVVLDGDEAWTIERVATLRPGPVTVLYALELKL